jgi:hypothetical protein
LQLGYIFDPDLTFVLCSFSIDAFARRTVTSGVSSRTKDRSNRLGTLVLAPPGPLERSKEMPMFDVEAFVAQLDRMGLILTALALADGKLRVNCWRTAQAAEHTQQIEDLWASEIGDDRSRINLLAAHLDGAQRRAGVTDNRVAPARPAAVP